MNDRFWGQRGGRPIRPAKTEEKYAVFVESVKKQALLLNCWWDCKLREVIQRKQS